MVDAPDMSAPVTRGELQEELKRLEQATSAKIQQAIEPLATKTELEKAIESLATKAELAKAIEPLATKVELEMWGGALLDRIEHMRRELHADLARHANALHESMVALIHGYDDKYKDLPPRVVRLESAVFAPKPP
jgi:hypothetical protein